MEILNYEEEKQNLAQQQQHNNKAESQPEEEEDAVPEISDVTHPIITKISGFKTIKSAFKSYAVYEILVTTENPRYGTFHEFSIERRFTHFLDLYARLLTQYPDATLPLPPPKNYPEFAAFDTVEENRVKWLQIFLDLLLVNPTARESATMVHFLTQKNPPDMIQTTPGSFIKSNVGKITEKIISLKYCDMDSDEWYLDLKSQLMKIESSIKSIGHKLGGSSLHFKSFAQLFTKCGGLLSEFAAEMGAGTPLKPTLALGRICSIIGQQCFVEGPVRSENESYNVVYSSFMVHLGSLNLILKSFKQAFEDRERNFRPISDLDAELKELQITKTIDEMSAEDKKALELVIAKKNAAIQECRKNFQTFSNNQKAVLSIYKKYLNQHIKTTLLQFLTSILVVEKNKLGRLESLKQTLN